MASLYTPESLLYQNYLRGNNGGSDCEFEIELSFDITINYVINEEDNELQPIFKQI